MFLNNEEIKEFTGCYSTLGQIHWLKTNNITHYVDANQNPVVTKLDASKNKKIARRKDMFSTKEAILKPKKIPRNSAGVYFLIADEEILYVGKTTSFFNRMASHDRGEIPFSHVTFMQIDERLLDVFEIEYIKKFKPKYNSSHNN